MRIEITYYAIDDTEFDDKAECEAYEKSLESRFDSVQFFDDECKPIPNTFDRIESDSFYIRILKADVAQALFGWLHFQCSFEEPCCSYNDGDILHWDMVMDGWENLTQKRDEINIALERIEKAVSSG